MTSSGVLPTFIAATCVATFSAAPLAAADLPAKAFGKRAPVSTIYDWTGFYLGGHVGYGAGSLGGGANPLLNQAVIFPASITGLFAGFQGGYRYQFLNHLVLGLEGDVSFPNAVDPLKQIPAPFNSVLDTFGSVRAVGGVAIGRWLPYVTAGAAWARTHVNVNEIDGITVATAPIHSHFGWTAGAGVELQIEGPWSAKLEYDYVDLGRRNFVVANAPLGNVTVNPSFHQVKAGLNYNFWDAPALGSSGDTSAQPTSGDWNAHVQTTFLEQATPRFRSPYAGPNSLIGNQGRETLTTTAFLGWRVWSGGEIYFNPEMSQGFGLSAAHGLAGFSNGEAQKGGSEFPRIRAQRYFLRQTFGLGGEQEDVPDGPNQLAGKRDINRVTVTIGRIALGDIFDQNAYAHDPRADFMNWALWEAAAYDMPSDLPGFTRGAVVELNRKDWAVRAGAFQVPSEPNSDILNFKTIATIAEFEERHTILDQPGKLRVGAFFNRENGGRFNDAFALVALDPTLDINTAIASVRRQNSKYGFYVNLEQQVAKDVGIFARASWNNGRFESMSFTDVDRSVSGGVSIKGSFWGRDNDTIGIGGAVNGISNAHRDFLAAGGLGLLIGDSRLNYRNEAIFESYYAWAVAKGFTWTFDYQFIANPAYNADRGPVSIFATRLHAEW
jgi:high affinity Mn2+ porin